MTHSNSGQGATVAALAWLVLATHGVVAAPLTSERIAGVPPDVKPAWTAYLQRSTALAREDREHLDAELTAAGMALPLRAPSAGDFSGHPAGDTAWFAGPAAAALADTVISYQTPSGGWSKHTDYAAGPRPKGMQWTSQSVPGKPFHYLATFDNHATTREITFLAGVASVTDRKDCQAAVDRGVRFVLDAQFPNGGWPQVFPLEGKYHDDITFNDDVMIDVLGLLQAVGGGRKPFDFLDEELRHRAATGMQKGLACVLATQVRADGRRTGWCAQYDPITLAPAAARAFEPASLSGMDSSRVLSWLMTLPEPDDELVAAIEDGLRWLDEVRVTGLRKTTLDGRIAFFEDPDSREVYWARFYDLTTGRPIFPGRDGVVYDSFEAMAARNPVAYHYLDDRPGRTLTTAATKWRKQRTPFKDE